MKFLEKELIFVTQEKFYQVQLSQKQKIDYESYQLVLNLVDKKFLRSFSWKKILLGYPYVKLVSTNLKKNKSLRFFPFKRNFTNLLYSNFSHQRRGKYTNWHRSLDGNLCFLFLL